MTMINRVAPEASPGTVFTKSEIKIHDKISIEKKYMANKNTLSFYLLKLAKLGGYLARANDPPPGNMIIWRGLFRLQDIELGFDLGRDFVGN